MGHPGDLPTAWYTTLFLQGQLHISSFGEKKIIKKKNISPALELMPSEKNCKAS